MKTNLEIIAQTYNTIGIFKDEDNQFSLYTINCKNEPMEFIATEDLINLAEVLKEYTITRKINLAHLEG